MKTVYFDCASGISGDMTLGALLDAGVPWELVDSTIASLELPGCRLEVEPVKRKGFRGTKVKVRYAPEHVHRHWKDIRAILDRGRLSDRQRQLAERVFRRLAEAEARVHNTTPEKVHFHEVGAVDSIVDIVGACVAWDHLGAERALSSPVAVGGGTIEIAHGRCSVPAPATAELLRGVPLAASPCDAELTTPTGAALLTCFVQAFQSLPAMTIQSIGYGAGDNDFATHPNLLRVFVGSLPHSPPDSSELEQDEVLCLETHLDDETGEVVALCTERLLEAGALDVVTSPLTMKKGRPGIRLSLLCLADDRQRLEAILFRHTSTIGVRGWTVRRSKLLREPVSVPTRFGTVTGKAVTLPGGGRRFAAEFESARQQAQQHQVSLTEVMRAAEVAFAAARHRSDKTQT